MTFGIRRSWPLGVALAVIAAPALAEASAGEAVRAEAKPLASADGQRSLAERSRRVELPFPLDTRAPEPRPPTATSRTPAAPHPFRESQLKRASLEYQGPAVRALNPRRLSQSAEYG